ncbi:MAG: hypothetical protein MHM6MM_007519, partial [Cercozoa sp. M6MM]
MSGSYSQAKSVNSASLTSLLPRQLESLQTDPSFVSALSRLHERRRHEVAQAREIITLKVREHENSREKLRTKHQQLQSWHQTQLQKLRVKTAKLQLQIRELSSRAEVLVSRAVDAREKELSARINDQELALVPLRRLSVRLEQRLNAPSQAEFICGVGSLLDDCNKVIDASAPGELYADSEEPKKDIPSLWKQANASLNNFLSVQLLCGAQVPTRVSSPPPSPKPASAMKDATARIRNLQLSDETLKAEDITSAAALHQSKT